jgi:hypothetical protein
VIECGREREVIAALHQSASPSGPRTSDPAAVGDDSRVPALPEPLRVHVETCPACAEAVTVARALLASAALDADEPIVASRWLLVKAHVRRRHLRAHRLERWHAWSILVGAWGLVLLAACLILPSLASVDSITLQATGLIGVVTFVLTAAVFLWRWAHLES